MFRLGSRTSRPDLFRLGNASSPKFDNVRLGKDVKVVDGKVGPSEHSYYSAPYLILSASTASGGISTFTKAQGKKNEWVLKGTTTLVAGLQAINDHGNHFLIAPAEEMTVETYTSHLKALNSLAQLVPPPAPKPKTTTTKPKSPTSPKSPTKGKKKGLLGLREQVEDTLIARSAHPDRATRAVYDALATVVNARVPIADWEENDYMYVERLARAVEDGSLPVSALQSRATWSRERAFVTDAASALMAHEAKRSVDEAAVAEEHMYLRAVLELDD
jgi:hypothetical protein